MALVCILLLACAVATGVLVLYAFWNEEQAEGLEAIAEWQDAMHALDPRGAS